MDDQRPWKAEPATGAPDPTPAWGSDIAAQMLRRLDIPYIALNPGASYRGLHDSLVNHLGNERPEILMCLHEEHAVAIAHGYAKATGRAMAVALHSNVGLMHGSMAIFNAFADRAPMLILGATGPVDATRRRPWIDWLHTAQDQAAMVRGFLKYDDQPGAPAAIPEAMLRAWKLANTGPQGPAYICLDAGGQESPLDKAPDFPDPTRFRPPAPQRADAQAVKDAAALLSKAKHPVILFGRGARTAEAMKTRVALAERLGAAMLSDLKAGAMVPTDHPQHAGVPFNKLSKTGRATLAQADAILSLGSVDLGGLLMQAFGAGQAPVPVVHAGQDLHLHHGWGQEHCALPPVDIELLSDPDTAAADLLEALPANCVDHPALPEIPAPKEGDGTSLTLRDVARRLRAETGETPVTFAALARGWPVDLWPHREPLDYLGKDGGGGVGAGPGLTIGAALALRDTGRITAGVLGDGDTLMSVNALWTAAKYRIPALILAANNRSYFNDELHQESVAKRRGRPPENAWIGQRIEGPTPDIAAMARAQGVAGFGPVKTPEELDEAIPAALAEIRAGRPALVDIHIEARLGREDAVPRATAEGTADA